PSSSVPTVVPSSSAPSVFSSTNTPTSVQTVLPSHNCPLVSRQTLVKKMNKTHMAFIYLYY
mgnify:CR=1